jgi:outer membrane protein OmpA-like peptidoglycan-associated protein
MKRAIIFGVFLCVLCASIGLLDTQRSRAYAQSTSPVGPIDIRRFSPSMDAQGFVSTERAVGLKTGDFNLGLMVDFSFDPLSQKIKGQTRTLVDQYSTGQLIFSIGFWEHLTLGVSQPLVIIQGDLDGPEGVDAPTSADGIGDTRFLAKGIILNSLYWPVGVAIHVEASMAFQQTHPLTSHGQSPLITPSLILDSEWQYVATSLNIGYALSDVRAIDRPVSLEMGTTPREDPIRVKDELIYRWGVSGRYIPGFFHHSLEVIGTLPTSPVGDRGLSLELLTGLRFLFNKGSHLTLGVGHGIFSGYADPTLRFFMGITFHPTSPDYDEDGIPDSEDRCPREKEDRDRFEDEDGCPENDNDHDGITDLYDQCPNAAEDQNKFEDEDGCPDGQRDLDQDGVLDPVDECPGQPEDPDGFADQDGCPELDNDGDSIVDTEDECPNQREDFDSFEDTDGCPEDDNDQDGIPDRKDQCPHQPEDRDGDRDLDGCPDSVQTPSPTISMGKGQLHIEGLIYFKTGKSKIKKQSYALLLEIALFINQHPEITLIEIQGHTDSRGRASTNLKLSKARAKAVKRFLITQGSVSADHLKSEGYGSSQPLDPAETPKAWRKNRRVEFKLIDTP